MLRVFCMKCGVSALPNSYLHNRGRKCHICSAWTCPSCAMIIDRFGKYCKYCFSSINDGKRNRH